MSLPRSPRPTPFSQWLKHARKRLDLTQDDLAALIACSLNAIRKIEAGERRPSRQMAELLAEVFAIPADEQAAFVHFARVVSTSNQPGSAEAAGAAGAAAPWRTLHRQHSHLPVPPTPLIGRAHAVRTTTAQLLHERTRLLTLIGPPGVGKTRLALEVATELLGHFAQGVFFVELTPISDPALVVATIAKTLGLKDLGNQPLPDLLKSYLTDKRLLLVLDNCEHVVEAAPQVADLLAGCPWLKVLTTSRIPLQVRGEKQIAVPPLELPDLTRLPPLAELTRLSAIALFVARAQDVDAAFALAGANAEAIAEICVRLDGLPLAIELAAVRTNAWSVGQIRAQLAGRLDALSGGLRDLPPRQQTLRSAIAWSYDLLEPREQQLFRRLALCQGGYTLEAIATICGGGVGSAGGELASSDTLTPLAVDVLAGVAALVRQSLLQQRTGRDGEPRFIMLETIHEYAREQLAAGGEAGLLGNRHLAYFLTLAEEAEPRMKGPDQVAWFARLEAEHDNLRVALSWAVDAGFVAAELRLVLALKRFWTGGYQREALRWLEGAVAHSAGQTDRARVRVLAAAGVFAGVQGATAQAMARLEESLALARALEDQAGIAEVLINLASAVADQGDFTRATALGTQSLAVWRTLGDQLAIANTLRSLGALVLYQGDAARARVLLQEALPLAQATGDEGAIGSILVNLGLAADVQGDLLAARQYNAEALELFRAGQRKGGMLTALGNLGEIAVKLGDDAAGAQLIGECLVLAAELGALSNLAACLVELAGVGTRCGQAPGAARLLGAADALMAAHGFVLDPLNQGDYARIRAAAEAQLGEADFAAAYAAGQALSLDEAIAEALEEAAAIQLGTAD